MTTVDEFVERLRTDPELAEQLDDLQAAQEVALLIARTRMALGLTQADFAHRAGVTQAYISQLESGTANPSVRRLARLFRRAGFDVTFSVKPLPSTSDADGVQRAAS
jgi:transcriptional regulator with XRE-family HTH domain